MRTRSYCAVGLALLKYEDRDPMLMSRLNLSSYDLNPDPTEHGLIRQRIIVKISLLGNYNARATSHTQEQTPEVSSHHNPGCLPSQFTDANDA